MDRKVMMRKYGLDEGRVYVETSTLLEPNNFIPSWEAGDEEKKEVSVALRQLRKRFDGWHKKAEERKKDLDLIQKQVVKCQLEEKSVEMGTGDYEFVVQKA